MKLCRIILIIACLLFSLLPVSPASYTRTTGERFGIDIPTAYILDSGRMSISQGFSIGKFEKYNPDREEGRIYSDGDLKINLGLFDLFEIGLLFYNDRNIVGNLQFRIIKDDPSKTYVPGISIGIQNITGEKHISPEGKHPEFDHFYAWTKDGELKSWEEDQFENNSFYVVASKNFKDTLVLHLGLGLGRFVGHSGWSGTQSFNDSEVAMFYGFSYIFPLRGNDKSLMFSMDADGRDWNIDLAFSLNRENTTHIFHMGSTKVEHWFKDVAFQPKFTFGYNILFYTWKK
ncbi:MAG TPA: hypothetical protein ENN73_00560 [Firmicutes bacterium]|nr:hypothetical protein [Bacillota bacterium]